MRPLDIDKNSQKSNPMKRTLQYIAITASLGLIGLTGCATPQERRTVPERGFQFPIEEKSSDPAILQVQSSQNYENLTEEEALAKRGSTKPYSAKQENLNRAARSAMYHNDQMKNQNSINQIQRTVPYIQHK